ncbi:MAG: amidohydrolase family protein [Thermodesulfobacteriota bacterium]|nr:amidohydrolase family protein [Thermodesulfobacteriota bacterium]
MKTLRVRLLFPVTQPSIENGKLVVDDSGRIIFIGKWDGKREGELITWDGMALPGLINTHVHLELGHLKDKIPKGEGVTSWVKRLQYERAMLNNEDTKRGIIEGIEKIKEDGVIAIGEVGNSFSSLQYLKNTPFRVVYFYEILGFIPDAAEEILDTSLNKIKHYQSLYPEVKFNLAPHALYSTSERLIKLIFSRKEFKVTSIHIAEGKEETQFLLTGNGPWKAYLEEIGKWPPDWKFPGISPVLYFKTIFTSKRTVLVHLCNISQYEIAWLKEKENIVACICPRSNLYITDKLSPIDKLFKGGMKISLGTDSLASNRNLSIRLEMKEVKRHFPSIPCEEIIRMATINGALSLGMEDELGSFEVGKRPGIILSETYNPEEFVMNEDKVCVKMTE